MTIRLYCDEDSSDSDFLSALRLRRIDVVAATESGLRGQPDEVQLGWAAGEGRVVYSFNRGDFYQLHSEWMRIGRDHAGIVLGVQQRYSIGEQLHRFVRLTKKLTTEDMRNRVEFLSAWG